MYNFNKSRDTRNRECFKHDNFVKGKKKLLSLIAKKKKKRDQEKTSNNGANGNNNNSLALPMARLNNFGSNGMYAFHSMPQLTDNPDFMNETKMQP